MDLRTLVQAQECGALKTEVLNNGLVKIGGVAVTPEQCMAMASTLGWVSYDKKPWEVIDKTNRFIRSIRNYVDNEGVINGTTVTFMNRRLTNTMKYFDRIKMVNPEFDITILYGMPGTGGAYAVYDDSDGFRQPVFNCRSVKQLAEYLNDLV